MSTHKAGSPGTRGTDMDRRRNWVQKNHLAVPFASRSSQDRGSHSATPLSLSLSLTPLTQKERARQTRIMYQVVLAPRTRSGGQTWHGVSSLGYSKYGLARLDKPCRILVTEYFVASFVYTLTDIHSTMAKSAFAFG